MKRGKKMRNSKRKDFNTIIHYVEMIVKDGDVVIEEGKPITVVGKKLDRLKAANYLSKVTQGIVTKLQYEVIEYSMSNEDFLKYASKEVSLIEESAEVEND